MKQVSLLLSFTLYLVVTAFSLQAQNYKFRQYGVEDGICHPFVYTINQDTEGYIWLGTGEGLCRYNGFEFDGDFEEIPSRMLLSKKVTGTRRATCGLATMMVP